MRESFEQMMARNMGEDFAEPPEPAAELCDFLARHDVPLDATVGVFDSMTAVLKAVRALRRLATHLEGSGLTQPGFRKDLEAVLMRHLAMGMHASD